ncbi:MAG: TlyA family RNA methyltransferase [Verrucomicrobia bacterium]|nr:TlyA family RNA methyltransferase [Verrucomicrobiota bacterium]MCF7709402.1 TlyA family RNA methyltransferase [Verrucomicrobiota bacterium]
MKRLRLDQAMVAAELCESREKAQRLLMAGQVLVNDKPAGKPGDSIKPDDQIRLKAGERYVSRGGLKLEHALTAFNLDVTGMISLDVGASTGGFTDCLLQHGAQRVFAVDVGTGQLAWKLRNDPRVVVMERTNARHLSRNNFPEPFIPFDLATVDCSFISLKIIIPPILELLRPHAIITALVKPQFEAGKIETDKGKGVITDPNIHRRVLGELEAFVCNHPDMTWVNAVESPITGPAGNREFIALIEKNK